MSLKTNLWAVATSWLTLLTLACGDDAAMWTPPAPSAVQNPYSVQPRDGGVGRVASCDNARVGTPCGEPGGGLHCIYEVCVANACGDGVVAGVEVCDDGNERDGDGCSSRCEPEPSPGCGNGIVEAGEECDDGADDDACTHACTKARCGDRIVSVGEECDDGNLNERDGCTNLCRARTLAGAGSGGSSGRAGAGGSGGGSSRSPATDDAGS